MSFLFLFFLFALSMANEAAGVPMDSNMAPEKYAISIRNYVPDSDNTLVSPSPPPPKHAIVTYGPKSPPPPSLVTVQELDTPAKPHPPTCFPQC